MHNWLVVVWALVAPFWGAATPEKDTREAVRYVSAASLPVWGHADDAYTAPFSRVEPDITFGNATIDSYAGYSTGLYLCFRTNSHSLSAKWQTSDRPGGDNMTAIVQKGLDLYIRDRDSWRFAGVGRPGSHSREEHSAQLVSFMPDGWKECLLYLPAFDKVTSLEIGIDSLSTLEPLPNPFRHKIVVLGSSITHGASASRSGMTWPALLERHSNLYCINLGFSGLCRLETSYARYLASLQADVFVIDAFSNPHADAILERFDAFVSVLREGHPETPLIFINTFRRETRNFSLETEAAEKAKQEAAREVVSRRMKVDSHVYFIDCKDGFLGDDSYGTADGVHPTDLGFARYLDHIEAPILTILEKYGIR